MDGSGILHLPHHIDLHTEHRLLEWWAGGLAAPYSIDCYAFRDAHTPKPFLANPKPQNPKPTWTLQGQGRPAGCHLCTGLGVSVRSFVIVFIPPKGSQGTQVHDYSGFGFQEPCKNQICYGRWGVLPQIVSGVRDSQEKSTCCKTNLGDCRLCVLFFAGLDDCRVPITPRYGTQQIRGQQWGHKDPRRYIPIAPIIFLLLASPTEGP